MNFENIITAIKEAIYNVDLIIEEEDFPAYPDVKKGLLSALNFIKKNDLESAKKHLYFSFRLLSEAPPKNADLGYDTLVKIDAASSLIKSIN